MPTASPSQILDAYFLETRAKLLEIAANLDRFDRAAAPADAASARSDPRLAFIHDSLQILQSDQPHRAERIQILYSKK